MSEQAERAPKRPVLWSILAVVAVGVGGFFWLDNWVRGQVADIASSKIEEVLSLDSDQPVEIDIAGVSVIAQVLTGRLEGVSAGVDNVRIGDLAGGVRLDASGIPIDLSNPLEIDEPIDRVQIAFTVGEDSVRQIASSLTLATVNSVELDEGLIQLGTGFNLLGAQFDLGVGIEPFARDGQLGFTPTTVDLNGSRTTVAELSAQYGPLVDSVFQTRDVCIARWLPVALAVDRVSVVGEELIIVISADKQLFTDAELRKLGSCTD
ncbi:DUF2993 domain-containing protein [uncultured Schumannella sp.]|uniref:LmeA family phospholipid-binding protein n=1 Tax=uncultured Schumannella sp. TaxID=1195956 RepID=UPI0025E504C9|nr:DUF2993 domain-containing protein [uncultured Schumannella sp.]